MACTCQDLVSQLTPTYGPKIARSRNGRTANRDTHLRRWDDDRTAVPPRFERRYWTCRSYEQCVPFQGGQLLALLASEEQLTDEIARLSTTVGFADFPERKALGDVWGDGSVIDQRRDRR
jgi:hypothetical protein